MTNQDSHPKDTENLRQKAEALARARAVRKPETSSALSPLENREILHELRVHQIELELQNEELRTAQVRIEAERVRYFDLYDLAPVGYCTLSAKGLILEANLTTATLLGSARRVLIKQPISRFILKDDQDIYYLYCKKLFETGDRQECELRLVKSDGACFWAHLTATAAQAEDGAPVCRCVILDITERKQAENKLRDSELFLHTTINSLKGHICVLDETGKIVLTNQAWEDFAIANGADPQCVSQGVNYLSVCDSVTGSDIEMASSCCRGIRAVLSGDRSEFSMEYPCHSPTEKRWFLGKVSPLQRKSSRWVVINHENITERKLAEDKLRDSVDRLSLATRAGGVGIWECDVVNNKMVWDAQMYHLYGITRDTFRGADEAWRAGVHPEDMQRVDDEVQRALRGEKEFNTEFRVIWPDGTDHNIRTLSIIQRDSSGKPLRMIGTNWDITDEKLAEEALRESEQQFRLLFQHLHAGVVVHGPDTQIILANEKACELLGLSVTQMTGKTANDPAWCFVREDETAMPLEEYPVQRVLATRRPVRDLVLGVDRPTTKDRVWILVHAFPEVDAHERLRHVVVTFVDITARKKAEKALWLKNLVFDASIAANTIVDLNGIITEVNDEFLRMWAYPGKDEVVGKPLANFINDTNDAVAIVTDLNETDRWDGVCRAKRKDGSIFIAHGLATTLRDRQDSLVGYQSAVLDITELKRVEEERNSLQVQLAHAQRMESVGRLAGGIAHDINNMLNIVLGYGEILFDELHPGDPLRDDVKEIVEAGKRSESMIRQLLAFSRKQTLQPEVLDLNTVIRNAEKMLSRLIGEDIELELALSDEIDRVMADPGQIEQVIMNLLVNARDAMPRGGKLILETANVVLDETFAKSHANVHPGKYVLLAVTDTGSGMDQETLTKIFDPFFTTKEMGKGTGLGLATVYGIVKQSGGNIWAYSEPGRGTTFKIYLPQTMAEQEPKMGAVGKETPKGGGEHILVVEDDDSVRKLTAAALSRLGYKVSVAANGGEALLLMEKKGLKPDLVLTDVVMPYMSGKELVNRLQIIQPDLKVLYMSGYTDDIIVRHGVLEPGTAFIHKPFNIHGIAEKVQAVLWGGGR